MTTAGRKTWTGQTASTTRAARSARRRYPVSERGRPGAPWRACSSWTVPATGVDDACAASALARALPHHPACPARAPGLPQGTSTSNLTPKTPEPFKPFTLKQGTATSRWSCFGATWRCGGSSRSACGGGQSSQVGRRLAPAGPAPQWRFPCRAPCQAWEWRVVVSPPGHSGSGCGRAQPPTHMPAQPFPPRAPLQ